MERYKAPTKFIQYQLWQDCGNNCLFCSERNPHVSNKLANMEYIRYLLTTEESYQYEECGIIGGELFNQQLDNEDVHDLFYELLEDICDHGYKKIYIATNLIYNMNRHLVECLNFLRKKGVQDKVLFCTSYDTKWRFHTEEQLSLWKANMLRFQDEFPDFNVHTEIILTGDFIDKVLNNDFDIQYFSDFYNTRIDFIEPASGMYYEDKADLQKVCPNFFPTKEQFMKFLKQECMEKKTVDIRCLISYQIRADRIYHLDSGQYVLYEDRRRPGFRVQCLDRTRKYELGLIDSDESMEDICTELCEIMPDD